MPVAASRILCRLTVLIAVGAFACCWAAASAFGERGGSKPGRIAYALYGRGVVTATPSGSDIRLVARHGSNPVWSPDGRWLAYEHSRRGGIWRVRADGTRNQRVSRAGTQADSPAWSPDGEWLAYTEYWTEIDPELTDDEMFVERTAISLVRRDGTRGRRLKIDGDEPAWSADGKVIAFRYGRSLAAIRPNGKRFRLVRDDVLPAGPRFSPTGRRLVFFTLSSLTLALQVLDMRTGTSHTIPVQALGAERGFAGGPGAVTWTPSGRRIAYLLNHWATDGGSLYTDAVELTTIRPDGTDRRTLSTLPPGVQSFSWSSRAN